MGIHPFPVPLHGWRFSLVFLMLSMAMAAAFPQTGSQAYREAMQRCEEAKRVGDFPAMAAAIRKALQYGRGNDPRQSFEFSIDNALSWERVSEGPRDFVEVVQKPGEPFHIHATVTIKAFVLGRTALLQPTPFNVPEALQNCLTPFHHTTLFDPGLPLCAQIAASLKADHMAQTVQNVLDWQHANMKYEALDGCSLKQILTAKKGVCHHFCSSFVALCRAAGVPAAVAHGRGMEAMAGPWFISSPLAGCRWSRWIPGRWRCLVARTTC